VYLAGRLVTVLRWVKTSEWNPRPVLFLPPQGGVPRRGEGGTVPQWSDASWALPPSAPSVSGLLLIAGG
jgi:hypothetical protein